MREQVRISTIYPASVFLMKSGFSGRTGIPAIHPSEGTG
jgi:hypothetical protein